MELSGYHHNVAYEFSACGRRSTPPAPGEVRFRNFTYRALP